MNPSIQSFECRLNSPDGVCSAQVEDDEAIEVATRNAIVGAESENAAQVSVNALLETANAAWLRHSDEMDDMSIVVALFRGFAGAKK